MEAGAERGLTKLRKRNLDSVVIFFVPVVIKTSGVYANYTSSFMKGLAHHTLKTSGEVQTFSHFNSCCYWKLSSVLRVIL